MSETNPTLKGWLRLAISEPATSGTAKLISVFIQFVLKCPHPACPSSVIWKDGFDSSHSKHPQRLVCTRCGRHFYPHTSYIFHILSKSLLPELVDSILSKGTPLKALARQYHISPAFLSRLAHHLSDLIHDHTFRAKKAMARRKLRSHLPKTLKHVVYMDETFLRILQTWFKLILTIDSSGNVLGWRLSRTRSATDIRLVLEQVLATLGRIDVLITDGFRSYKTAIRQLQLSLLHIRHIHSHPWWDVHLTAYEYRPKEHLVHEMTVGIAYDAFVRPGPAFGWVFTQIRKVSKAGRDPGRPRGAKDKKPRRRRKGGATSRKVTKNHKGKKRGSKNVFRDGMTFQFYVAPSEQCVELEGVVLGSIGGLDAEIEPVEVLRLLWTAGWFFKWGYVTNNLIEGRISQIKHRLPRRGRRSEEGVKRRLEVIVSDLEPSEEEDGANTPSSLPSFPHLGFVNLGKFITPQIEAMEVSRA